MTIASPLTHSQNVTLLKTINADQLICGWKNSFNIDISQELHSYPEIYLYQCSESKLSFFVPWDIAGSDKLYEQLEGKFDWYYMPRKWEHDVAIRDIKESDKVLEVGCGRGAFVQRLSKEMAIDAQGIELNKKAVLYAQELNINISQKDLYELAREVPNTFDVVCSFQVLEHVSQPKEFLNSMLKLLKPGGKLIISVPNRLSFTQYCCNDFLDKPPHHMTQWSIETFQFLNTIFPLQLEHYKYEPLAEYHVEWYLGIQMSRLPKVWILNRLFNKVIQIFIKPLLKEKTFLRNFIKGHTIYVCFAKSL